RAQDRRASRLLGADPDQVAEPEQLLLSLRFRGSSVRRTERRRPAERLPALRRELDVGPMETIRVTRPSSPIRWTRCRLRTHIPSNSRLSERVAAPAWGAELFGANSLTPQPGARSTTLANTSRAEASNGTIQGLGFPSAPEVRPRLSALAAS